MPKAVEDMLSRHVVRCRICAFENEPRANSLLRIIDHKHSNVEVKPAIRGETVLDKLSVAVEAQHPPVVDDIATDESGNSIVGLSVQA